MGTFKKGKNYYVDYYSDGKRKREKVGPNKKLGRSRACQTESAGN